MEQKNNLYWKRFLEILWSNFQVPLQQVDQEFIQLSSEHLQGQRPHSFTRQPVSMSGNPRRKKYFLIFQQNFLYFNLNPSPFILLLHNSKNSLFSLHPSGGINNSKIFHQPFLLQLKTLFSQFLLAHQMTQSSNQLGGPHVNSLQHFRLYQE